MKFFTPQLFVMGQSQDDRVLDEQERLWEEAGEKYATYLESVRSRFPAGLRRIDESYYLHDAVIRGMGRRGRSFVIILQLDTPPQSILTLSYDLAAEPIISKDALPPDLSGTGGSAAWLYDEIELIHGDPVVWRQSILLNNGWEIALQFRDVQVEEVQAVFPTPRNGSPVSAALLAEQVAP